MSLSSYTWGDEHSMGVDIGNWFTGIEILDNFLPNIIMGKFTIETLQMKVDADTYIIRYEFEYTPINRINVNFIL